MADLNGINTRDNAAAIRAKLYSGMLREQLEPELIVLCIFCKFVILLNI